MKVIGIDPGTTTIWYAVIEKNPQKHTLLDFWVITTPPKVSLEIKISEIAKDFEDLLIQYQPQRVVIEKLYFLKNITTWIDVAQVRGVIVYLCTKYQTEILEYTPLELKSAICGNGKAHKKQLQKAIQLFFWLPTPPQPDDAADAIGLAYMGVLKNNLTKN